MEETNRRTGFRLRVWPLLTAAVLGGTMAWVWTSGEDAPSSGAPSGTAPVSTTPADTAPSVGSSPSPPLGSMNPPPRAAETGLPGRTATDPVFFEDVDHSSELVKTETRALAAPIRFREIWTYLTGGSESRWPPGAPITDLALFDLTLGATGQLEGTVKTDAIARATRAGVRTHLTIASSGNKTLFHLALSPQYGVREALLQEIADLPSRYPISGIQLDFEAMRPEEGEHFLSFVRALKARLPGGTMLSLAIPARVKDRAGAFSYPRLAGLAGVVDRLFIMVYDLHWSGGPPGAISDLAWHERVLQYAKKHFPPEQVVVGLPFYGRVWQEEKVARALYHSGVQALAERTGATIIHDPAGSHSFTYVTEVTAECWFEDVSSLAVKLSSTRDMGFQNVGFWQLGQEDPRIWDIITYR